MESSVVTSIKSAQEPDAKLEAEQPSTAEIMANNEELIHNNICKKINSDSRPNKKYAELLGITPASLSKKMNKKSWAWPYLWVESIAELMGVGVKELTGQEDFTELKSESRNSVARVEEISTELVNECIVYVKDFYQKKGIEIEIEKLAEKAVKLASHLQYKMGLKNPNEKQLADAMIISLM